jgi:NADPH:quinone reductase-like Zn-dependent oxidoreductase
LFALLSTRKNLLLKTVMSSSAHTAAILRGHGKVSDVATRPTPTPGIYEVLIEAKDVAINPIDHIQQSHGLKIARYPVVRF